MTTINDAVRAGVKGMYPAEAGVELLIRHGLAIRDDAPWITRTGDVAHIDVDMLLDRGSVWSGGQYRVVLIACSLIDGSTVNLSDVISGLDRTALDLVLAALSHASGSHEFADVTIGADGQLERNQPVAAFPWPPTS